jgi:hypothetical protein
MALSAKAKKRLEVAMARRAEAQEIISAIEAGGNTQAAAVADIADPSTATAEDVANKVNELLASLRAAGLLAT